jgi:hypothetical protein
MSFIIFDVIMFLVHQKTTENYIDTIYGVLHLILLFSLVWFVSCILILSSWSFLPEYIYFVLYSFLQYYSIIYLNYLFLIHT